MLMTLGSDMLLLSVAHSEAYSISMVAPPVYYKKNNLC